MALRNLEEEVSALCGVSKGSPAGENGALEGLEGSLEGENGALEGLGGALWREYFAPGHSIEGEIPPQGAHDRLDQLRQEPVWDPETV
jgi:hypothetical protein